MAVCPSTDIRTPRGDEDAARDLLAPHLDGELIAWQPAPDFMLCRDGQQIGWLEVTIATNQDSHTFFQRRRRDGTTIQTDRLSHDWMVMFRLDANLAKLNRDHLVDTLVHEEHILARDTEGQASDRQRKTLFLADLADRNTIRKVYAKYGISRSWVQARAEGRDAVVSLGQSGPAAWVHPATINLLAEAKAAEKKKSLDGLTGQRHLFIWVDPFDTSGAGFVLRGVDGVEAPDQLPTFPAWVTDIWMYATYGEPRLWHCTTGEAWETFED